MAGREDDRRNTFDAQVAERLIDAVARDDRHELDRICDELERRDDMPLIELEHAAESAVAQRKDSARAIDRLRNIFQALVLHRWLRLRRSLKG